MPHGKLASGARPVTTGYSHVARTAVQETTQRVREMHGAIAGKSFAALRRIPLVSRPARLLICLGFPSLGSPLERLGHLANAALNLSPVTRPLAVRSRTRSKAVYRAPGWASAAAYA
jgi:hypothetical protein